MAGKESRARAVVLSREIVGETTLKLDCLTDLFGLMTLRKRISAKSKLSASSSARPDLFDTANVRFDDESRFVKDYELLKRRHWIGSNYSLLLEASFLASFLTQNLYHLPDAGSFVEIVEKALDGMTTLFRAQTASVKVIFQIGRQEGYAVQEGWLRDLAADVRMEAIELLKSPLDTVELSAMPAKQILCSLLRWSATNTDFNIDPKWLG